ncbi:MAG: hypothetical protein AAFX06_29195 [Planctomycetota bacterium]
MNRPSLIWTLGLPAVLLAATATLPTASAERWTTLGSGRTVEAEFIGLWGESVVLQLEDQRRVTVDINLLVAESRILARELGEKQRKRRQDLVNGIRSDSDAASAPAPDPIPKPRTPPTYRPYSGGSGLLERLEWLEDQAVNNGHFIAVFDSLPASYQSDLDRIAKKAASKANAAAVSQGVTAIHSIGELIVTRQRWLFSHPRVEALPDEAGDMIKQVLLGIGGMIRDGMDPAEFKLEKLQQTSLRAWLMDLDQRMSPYIVELQDMANSASAAELSFEVLSENGDQATFQFGVEGNQQVVNVIQVEGVWVPEALNPDAWKGMMQEADAMLDNAANGSLLSEAFMLPGFVNVVVQPAMSAESASDLHALMDQWISQVGPMVASQMGNLQMGMGQANAGGPGARGNSQYGGYEDYEDADMDMEAEMSGYEDMNDGSR